jgi:hypothetical protein
MQYYVCLKSSALFCDTCKQAEYLNLSLYVTLVHANDGDIFGTNRKKKSKAS